MTSSSHSQARPCTPALQVPSNIPLWPATSKPQLRSMSDAKHECDRIRYTTGLAINTVLLVSWKMSFSP
eukprot:807715-Pyramimonas_sp.AAC.1